MKHLRGYIVKRPNGLYLITKLQPKITNVLGTNKLDAYIIYGDPVGFLNVEPNFVKSIYVDLNIEPLTTHRMVLFGSDYPTTHKIKRQFNNLCIIYEHNNADNKIINVCPWFIKTVFEIDELTPGISYPIHFSGELTE